MITEDVPAPTEQDAIQSMKDEGTFDDLRRACLECLEKNPSYISLRSDSDADVDLFLSKQKWKNSAEYKEQARREPGIIILGLLVLFMHGCPHYLCITLVHSFWVKLSGWLSPEK